MQLSETLFKDNKGRMIERINFNNGLSDYFYSDYLHKINFICSSWGLDANNYNDFQKAILITN